MSYISPNRTTSAYTSGSSNEVPVHIEDLFFSRTDKRGVIESANDVFARISGYEWSEILGAPHKIVRHSDTPKGVFYLVWEALKAGHPKCAYIKNRAKDGRFYWAMAAIGHLSDGYTSIRMKPTSKVFQTVQAIYADLHALEADGLSPEDSAVRLEEMIKELGYESYDAFAAHGISEEIFERDKALGRKSDAAVGLFRKIDEASLKVNAEVVNMIKSFNTLKTVSTNMRIVAARLEDRGRSIAEISSNYGSMCEEMTKWMRMFFEGQDCKFAHIRQGMSAGLLQSAFMSVSSETKKDFEEKLSSDKANELSEAGIKLDIELSRLTELDTGVNDKLAQAITLSDAQVAELAEGVEYMKRQMTGLHSTRIMCKVESAPIAKIGDTLSGIVEQLDLAQDQIEAQLSTIADLNSTIRYSVEQLLLRSGR